MLAEQVVAADGMAGFVGSITDITERVAARESLQRVETLFQHTFEQAPIGISITDLEGHFLTTNQRMRRILGYEYEELSKRNVWDVAYEADRPHLDSLRADLQAGRIAYFAMEKRIVRPDGELRWVACSSVSFSSKD